MLQDPPACWGTTSGMKYPPPRIWGSVLPEAHPASLRRHLCCYSTHTGHRSLKACSLLHVFIFMRTGGNSRLKARITQEEMLLLKGEEQ